MPNEKKIASSKTIDHSFAKRHENDTGSPEVQISLLTEDIGVLQNHIRTNIHDVDAKRSLLKKVARRKSFLRYLKKTNLERYEIVSKKLKLS